MNHRRLLAILVGALAAFYLNSYATPPKKDSALEVPSKIQLKIKFDWQKPPIPFNGKGLHETNTVVLDLQNPLFTVVSTQTVLSKENTPVTLALLVRPMEVLNKAIAYQFQLVAYGFPNPTTNYTTLISEPRLILADGQWGSVSLSKEGVKVSAESNWLK